MKSSKATPAADGKPQIDIAIPASPPSPDHTRRMAVAEAQKKGKARMTPNGP